MAIGFKIPGGPDVRVGGQVGGVLETGGKILESGGKLVEDIGAEIDLTAAEKRAKKKRAKQRAATEAAATAKTTAEREGLERRRRPLRLRGQRATRLAGTTPDLFAASAGQVKTLLG